MQFWMDGKSFYMAMLIHFSLASVLRYGVGNGGRLWGWLYDRPVQPLNSAIFRTLETFLIGFGFYWAFVGLLHSVFGP